MVRYHFLRYVAAASCLRRLQHSLRLVRPRHGRERIKSSLVPALSAGLATDHAYLVYAGPLSDQVLVDQVNAWADYGALEPAGAAALCAVAGPAGRRGLADQFANSIDETCRWLTRPSGAICAAAPSSRSAPLFLDLSHTWERHRDTRRELGMRADLQT